MRIAELFKKNITRPINGVVKADERGAEAVWQELDEYVVTQELDRHFRRFFELPKIDYSVYENKPVIIKGCSRKPVPMRAYVLAAHYLQPFARSIMYGEACSAVPLYKAPKKG